MTFLLLSLAALNAAAAFYGILFDPHGWLILVNVIAAGLTLGAGIRNWGGGR